ncbi:hypothetical protein ElyMa_003771300 [Elysia marginata]|uniref:Uncharacterized protein n=1 Tax=Elysia marginata TaxID=1093978 RepID=A0AAV4F960_9GAST|nr:hypothetical protein ElyMa_003771300 [Elysia marginata]
MGMNSFLQRPDKTRPHRRNTGCVQLNQVINDQETQQEGKQCPNTDHLRETETKSTAWQDDPGSVNVGASDNADIQLNDNNTGSYQDCVESTFAISNGTITLFQRTRHSQCIWKAIESHYRVPQESEGVYS